MRPATFQNHLFWDFIYIILCTIKKIKKVSRPDCSPKFHSRVNLLSIAADYSAPLGDLESFENEWVEVEMRSPKEWCEPASPTTLSTMSSPITISSCDDIDESNVPPFLRDNIDLTESMDDKSWTGKSGPVLKFSTNVARVNLGTYRTYRT